MCGFINKMFYNTDFLTDGEIRLLLEKTQEADPAKGWVTQYYFGILRSDDVKVGVCSLRAGHNENTYYIGNIAYGVYEPFRGHHYAGKACLLLLNLAKKLDMGYVIITCSPDNDPSRKTCEYAGGHLEAVFTLPSNLQWDDNKTKCRYRIEL